MFLFVFCCYHPEYFLSNHNNQFHLPVHNFSLVVIHTLGAFYYQLYTALYILIRTSKNTSVFTSQGLSCYILESKSAQLVCQLFIQSL